MNSVGGSSYRGSELQGVSGVNCIFMWIHLHFCRDKEGPIEIYSLLSDVLPVVRVWLLCRCKPLEPMIIINIIPQCFNVKL